MIVLKYLSRFILFLALAVLTTGIWIWLAGNDITKSAGEILYQLNPESLNLSQAIVERYLSPQIWQQGAVPLLLKPFKEAVFLLFIFLLILATSAKFFPATKLNAPNRTLKTPPPREPRQRTAQTPAAIELSLPDPFSLIAGPRH